MAEMVVICLLRTSRSVSDDQDAEAEDDRRRRRWPPGRSLRRRRRSRAKAIVAMPMMMATKKPRSSHRSTARTPASVRSRAGSRGDQSRQLPGDMASSGQERGAVATRVPMRTAARGRSATAGGTAARVTSILHAAYRAGTAAGIRPGRSGRSCRRGSRRRSAAAPAARRGGRSARGSSSGRRQNSSNSACTMRWPLAAMRMTRWWR